MKEFDHMIECDKLAGQYNEIQFENYKISEEKIELESRIKDLEMRASQSTTDSQETLQLRSGIFAFISYSFSQH